MSKKHQPLIAKDYVWILVGTVGVLALVPVIAAFGALMQVGFVLVMPAMLIGSALHAFSTEAEQLVTTIMGIEVPNDVRLHRRHAWARRASSNCVVAGVDDFAQRLIGPVEAIETAKVGEKVQEGDVIATLRRGGREIPVLAPMDGTIAYVNPALERDPAVVNRSCYGRGWLVEITPEIGDLKPAFKKLLGEHRAARWMRGEIDRLVSVTAPPELGMTMADGGEVGSDVSGGLDDETWQKVHAEFYG